MSWSQWDKIIAQYTLHTSVQLDNKPRPVQSVSLNVRPRIRMMGHPRPQFRAKADLPVGFPYRFNSSCICVVMYFKSSKHFVKKCSFIWPSLRRTGWHNMEYRRPTVCIFTLACIKNIHNAKLKKCDINVEYETTYTLLNVRKYLFPSHNDIALYPISHSSDWLTKANQYTCKPKIHIFRSLGPYLIF